MCTLCGLACPPGLGVSSRGSLTGMIRLPFLISGTHNDYACNDTRVPRQGNPGKEPL